jgi:hypothetical protein
MLSPATVLKNLLNYRMTKTKSQKQRAKQAQKNGNSNSGGQRQNGGPKKARRQRKGKRVQEDQVVATALQGAVMYAVPRIGMSDLSSHRQSWICGQIWVGDGSNGALQSNYFATNTFVPTTTAGLVPGNSGGGMVPILGSDARVGQTYIADIRKHFARIRIRKCLVHFIPLNPSTSAVGNLVVAPVRGAAQSGDTVVFTAAATASPTIANTLSMNGASMRASWERVTLDLSPFIAGGSGADQNEFAVTLDADTTAWGTGAMDMDFATPACFVVAGTNSGINGAAGGAYSHVVVVEQIVDLLDFIGGNTPATPEA